MSGAEKFVIILVAAAVEAAITASRNRAREREVIIRTEQQHSYISQMRARRGVELKDRLARIDTALASLQGEIDISTEQEIQGALSVLHNRMLSGETDYNRAEQDVVELERRMATIRRGLDEQAARRTSQRSSMLRQRMKQLEARLAELATEVDDSAEQAAMQEAQRALAELEGMQAADDVQQEFSLRMATRSIDKLQVVVEQDEDRRRERHNAVLDVMDRYDAVVSGLEADPTVMRWLPGSVAELRSEAGEHRRRIGSGDHSGAALLLEQVRRREQELVDRASAAQIKADQRDYIVDSIRMTLIELGFVVSEAREEHPGHPATAMLLNAMNDAGRGINVSIPVDGEVIYNIDGFEKRTLARVGGGSSATCDEAQKVLQEMHQRLREGFQLSPGELRWEGMDPDRILRSADELPSSGREIERRRDG